MSQNQGKRFEQDFANSFDRKKWWVYRLRDNAASFAKGNNTRFASSNICDYILFHNDTKTLYLLELKSTKNSSIPYSMIRENQITELTYSSKYNLVAGFIFNFREKNNVTYFMHINDFNEMTSCINKKSFNIMDIQKYNSIEINNKKKRTRYTYDTNSLVTQM